MHNFENRSRLSQFLVAVVAIAVASIVSLPTALTSPAHAAEYTGTFTFDGTDPGMVTGCSTSCTGMAITIPALNGATPVTTIGYAAFDYLDLVAVTIPNSVTHIKNDAFRNNQLTSVVIPDSVTRIDSVAFHTNKLTSLVLGNSVTSVGVSSFSFNELTSLTIPNSVTTIDDNAFDTNKLTSLVLGNSVTSIGSSAFFRNQITSVSFPNSLLTIGADAFSTNNLATLQLPNSLTSLGNNAFINNELTSIQIPASVTTFGSGVFSDNILTSIEFLGNRPTMTVWGTKVWSLQCIYYTAGKTGWPGKALNGITPTEKSGCAVSGAAATTTTTTTTIPAVTTTAPPSASVSASAGYFSFTNLTLRQIAVNAGLNIWLKSKITAQVIANSAKTCKLVKGKLVGLRTGTCRISVAVKTPQIGTKRGFLAIKFKK
jgi:hypothetical protein